MRKALFLALSFLSSIAGAANIVSSTTWFGNGGYVIPKQDIWPKVICTTCTVGVNWDGTTAKLAGFKNEMIGGMLWMKAGASDATGVSVAISPLTGPGGSTISSTATLCANVTNYTTRDFELFVATYVQIIGMTQNSWDTSGNSGPYEERNIPLSFQNPYTINGSNQGVPTPPSLWTTRAGANKFFPDALVPQECTGNFTVKASSSQGVWMDFYLKKTLNVGLYSGTITVTESAGVTVSTTIPIQITVYNGTLSDTPSYNYITDVSEGDINYRENGIAHEAGCSTAACINTDNAFYAAMHRHRMQPIGDEPDVATNDYPSGRYHAMLDGSLFVSTNGYQGPGVNTGVSVYSIGTYQSWGHNPTWSATNSTAFCVNVSSWGFYFKNNFPNVRSFLYLTDEPVDLTQTNQWSTWMSTITACQTSGYKVHSWVTEDWPAVNAGAIFVDMPASTNWIEKLHTQAEWQTAADRYLTSGSTQGWAYNGHPSWNGTCNATEDDGMSCWEGVWADTLKGVKGHFQWQATNWYNPGAQNPAENPLWTQAKTFGYDQFPSSSAVIGHDGFNFSNGDGVWMYPGTEVSTYTASNYGFLGAVATLRMKNVRRSINDADYLSLAQAKSPGATSTILTSIVPIALWDITCFDPSDCSYSYGGRLWNQDPNAWELARQQLATIITSYIPGPVSTSISGNVKINGRVTVR